MNALSRFGLGSGGSEAVPATVNEAPAVVSATKVRSEMLAKLSAFEAEIRELNRAIYEAREGVADSALDDRARAMMAGVDLGADLPDLTVRLSDAIRGRDIAGRAARLAAEKLSEAREAATTALARAAAPRHREMVRRIARALAELSDASEAEAAFHREMREGGAGSTGITPVMSYPYLLCGPIDQHGSPSFTWLAAARRDGFVDADEDSRKIGRGRA